MTAKLKIAPFLEENLACPMCRANPLGIEKDRVVCPACNHHFPINEGVCYMLPDYSDVNLLSHQRTESEKLSKDINSIEKKIEHYDESAGKFYDEVWMIPGGQREVVERVTAFEELDLKGGEVVLDIGAGTLRNGLYAIEQGAKVICGIDLIPGMLKWGKRKADERGFGNKVCIIVADVRFIPFRGGTFHSIISLELIEHIPVDIDRVFSEIFRVLKPGGKAVVNTWKKVSCFHKRRRENLGCFRGDNFYKRYSEREFKSLFTNIGFSEERIFGHYFQNIYVLLHKLRIPRYLAMGLAIERVARHYFPKLSILLGSFLLVRLRK